MTHKHQTPNPVHVQQFLGGLDYPAGKESILQRAEQQGADRKALKVLQQIPDQEYANPIALTHEVSKIH